MTGGPPKHPHRIEEPPTPARGRRVAHTAMKFNLRRTDEAGRRSTIGLLMDRWAVVPTTHPDNGFSVHISSAREYAGKVQRQDKASIPLPPALLDAAGEKWHASYIAGQSVDVHPAFERAIVETVVVKTTYRLPYAAISPMAELDRIKADYAAAGQSSLWLQSLGNEREGDRLVDSDHNQFLMPTRVMLAQMKAVVKGAIGSAPLSGGIWKRTVRQVVDPTSGEAVDVQSSWSLDARTVVSPARPGWLKRSFVDTVLVKLGSWSSSAGNGVHVRTSEKLTAMLRTPQGCTIELAEARRLGMRWALGAGRCTQLATMVTHGSSHWCAAVIHLTAREISFYDSLAHTSLYADC